MPLSRHRWLQFSLRTAFVVLTVQAVWLGAVANHAREQRDAVMSIEALGGSVYYDWQPRLKEQGPGTFSIVYGRGRPGGPAWLRRLIGDDYFQSVLQVRFSSRPPTPDANILKSIPQLRRLRRLEAVSVSFTTSQETQDQLQAALPKCQVHARVH